MTLSLAMVLGDIFVRCYYDHSIAATSPRVHHISSLLLRITAATVIWVISPRAVATKGHNNDLPISSTSLIESETGLHKYLLILSA
jgi:hypothetical protein